MLDAMLALRNVALLSGLLCLITPGHAQHGADPPRVWRICVGDSAVPPYVNNDPLHLGRAERLVVEAGRSIDVSVLIQRYPPRRCRAMLESGDSDMALAGPTPENLRDYVFPMKAGAVDAERRLASLNLVWVRRPDSRIDWDGRRVVGAIKGKVPLIGVRAGQRVGANAVHALNYAIDETALNTKLLLRMLAAGRFDLALGLQEEIELRLSDPDSKPLVVLPRALARQDFYAVAGLSASPASLAMAERFWAAVGRIRDLPEFKRD